MAKVRRIDIRNFRAIKRLSWRPHTGMNCLIGPGDSGKSTILDAIDLCLGARRSIQFSDADFHRLDVSEPILVEVTLGELDDVLKSLESYGLYLRTYCETGEVEDEPDRAGETVLTVRLAVDESLEPNWSLVSQRADEQSLSRDLSWKDRVRVAPTRLDAFSDYHLGWRQGSVVTKLANDSESMSVALAHAARTARESFGEATKDQVGEVLKAVERVAREMGVPVGSEPRALLDATSVSFRGGTISIHDEHGVPLRRLGVGSRRLLVAGLQRAVKRQSGVVLVDEVEHGLEPHRVIRLLNSLTMKDDDGVWQQVFATTHSPITLRELSGDELFVCRALQNRHEILPVGSESVSQGTIRRSPDVFLSKAVIVCEGASETGLIRGLNKWRVSQGHASLYSRGASLLDSGGGDADRVFVRGRALLNLGYRVSVLRDSDKTPSSEVTEAFESLGGEDIHWSGECTTEDQLFRCLSPTAVDQLLNLALSIVGKELIDEHIRTASNGTATLQDVRSESDDGDISVANRTFLGKAARTKKNSWFKTVTHMQQVGETIVGPDLDRCADGLSVVCNRIFEWLDEHE